MQKRKERRGFVREEKRMMSIWHIVWWRKQEGHNKKKLFKMLSKPLSHQKKLQNRE
jgi:hypothetical protein